MSIDAVPTPPKLPFWRTVGRAYAGWFTNLPYLLRISWLWLLVMTPIMVLMASMLGSALDDIYRAALHNPADPALQRFTFYQAYYAMLVTPMFASIAVGWSRMLLLGERIKTKGYLRLDGVVLYFAAVYIIVWVLPMLPNLASSGYALLQAGKPSIESATTGLIIQFIATIATVIGGLITFRLCMVLFAEATDGDLTYGQAWQRTTRNSWRLYLGVLLCALPSAILGMGIYPLVFAIGSHTATLAIVTSAILINSLVALITYTYLIYAYEHFFGRPESEHRLT